MNEKKSVTTNNNGDAVLDCYNPFLIVLNTDREVLYDRINKRVELMFEEGLEQEVKEIIEDDSHSYKNNPLVSATTNTRGLFILFFLYCV